MGVKGLELPAYDPRALQGLGLNYATSVRGGCHVYGYMTALEQVGVPIKMDPKSTDSVKVTQTIAKQDVTAFIDSTGMCLFTSFALSPVHYAAAITTATGIHIDANGVLTTGARIWTAQKLFNLKAGITKDADTLPKRLLSEPLQDKDFQGAVWKREELLGQYYKLRGWDTNGVPTPATLASLGLSSAT
eukprot:TRINITY_DN469_c0_g1_i3.p1 TRINITY_DN469_c0_g1~~TRINITY_DN469_c0_g1_i3.p1  ORF type:complete len:213 (+),score=57.96 TRINITY_DN469_c0_g1_i3:75-641(+)